MVLDQLLRVRTSSNSDGDFCCDTQHILTKSDWDDYPLWLTSKREIADEAIKESTPWYNAGYDSPSWDDSKWKLEVVEVEIIVKINGKVSDQKIIRTKN